MMIISERNSSVVNSQILVLLYGWRGYGAFEVIDEIPSLNFLPVLLIVWNRMVQSQKMIRSRRKLERGAISRGIIWMGLAQKAKKDWVKELCNKNKVSFVGLQETKMESIDLLSVRLCWGNVNFDYVHSDSIGNSGGILCIWDPNSFRKDSVTVSDYFVIVRGVWIKSGMDILIVVVYAPHDVRDKRLLWDYLSHVSNQWAGLEEVPLGGSAYTWCHKSASKMSKLDRFLVSENLLNTCPNISAITLDRFLSDHRPILLREASC
ncbi:RNA-directed DNA polymerase, eukaryota [Tanacetum coccineum]